MKKVLIFFTCFIPVLFVTACAMTKISEEKIRDIEFTVLKEEEIPEKLLDNMRDQEKNGFRLSYAEAGFFYIAIGYGEQEKSGYSIEVKECYETKNAIYVHTDLIGPKKEEESLKAKTYPSLVLKFEWIDKHIVFV